LDYYYYYYYYYYFLLWWFNLVYSRYYIINCKRIFGIPTVLWENILNSLLFCQNILAIQNILAQITFFFSFEFEFRASQLLGGCSNTWAICPAPTYLLVPTLFRRGNSKYWWNHFKIAQDYWFFKQLLTIF
jgi:hypothetical protein